MMKRFFAYFGFTKAERRGFSVLVLLVFIIGIVPVIYGYFKTAPAIEHSVTYFSSSDEDDKKEDENKLRTFSSRTDKDPRNTRDISYFYFDPNGMSKEDWQRLGFSDKQIAVIKNYEAKGGKFYKKEDVAKIYSISEKDYERIAPYIVIESYKRKSPENNLDTKEDKVYKPKQIAVQSVDINAADTSAFKQLRGIGSVLSARVVKYRDALGGFHDISQVGEVYGITQEVYEQIAPLLVVGRPNIKRLRVNTVTKEELTRHPYISKKQASLIVNYRSQHGSFASLDDLRKIPVLDDDFFRKIEPYIEF